MKKIVLVFPRQRYVSDSNGAPQLFPMNESLMSALGSATDLRWEVTIYAKSGTDARMQIAVSEGTKSEVRSSSNVFGGVALASVPASSTPTHGAQVTHVSGPFGGLVDAVLKVWDNANTSTQWVDAEVRVTLIFNH